MKFSTAIILSGAAVASAASLPRDYCPVVKKTIKLTWIELKVFEKGKAETWSREDTKVEIEKSKFDPSQVYPSLNNTYGGGSKGNGTSSVKGSSGYPTGKVPYGLGSSSGVTVKPTTSSSGRAPTASSKTTTVAPFPTGGPRSNSTSSTGFSVLASSSSSTVATSTSTTTSAEPSVTVAAWPCTAPEVRREWRSLDDGQRDAYVAAVRCLMTRESGDSGRFPGSRSRYDDFVSLHQQLTPTIHSLGQFLPWHRYYLHVYEEVLSAECGYNGPLVWWDETVDAGAFAQAPLFTERWFGVLPGPENGQGVCVGQTGWGDHELNIGPGGLVDNPHCLSRAVNEDATANVNQGWVDDCRRAANYNDHRRCNEFGPHAYGHNGIGAVMSDVSPSPGDPLFFLHHGFVDRNYKVWQNDQWWNRVYEIGGPANGNGDPVTPDYVLSSLGIRPDVRIADVLDTEASYLCYVYDKQ